MKVINEALLRFVVVQPFCEWCKAPNRGGLDPHHVRHRGSGRVDVKENLVALCRADHTAHHAGNEPTTAQLMELVAKREGKSVASIRRKIDRLRADQTKKVWEVER